MIPPTKASSGSQVFLVIGAVAVCFFPAVIYYITTERTDLVFRLLSAGLHFLSSNGYIDSSVVRFSRCAQSGYDYHLNIQNVYSRIAGLF